MVVDINISEIAINKSMREVLGEEHSVYALRWLGQAGFEVFAARKHLMLDPYLSDSLAKKYAGKEFAHQRMMETPIKPEDVVGLDYLLCTHRHSDHIDPETVPVVMANNPACIMLAPRAEYEHVASLGINLDRVQFVNAGETLELGDGLLVEVIPSAHEKLKTDINGNHHFLGYILSSSGVKLYHSGDCVPYEGQAGILAECGVDIALLPINGRDEYRASHGVPGNMKFAEAVSLCQQAGIKNLICHHFGMFSFNTTDIDAVYAEMKNIDPVSNLGVIIPNTFVGYAVTKN